MHNKTLLSAMLGRQKLVRFSFSAVQRWSARMRVSHLARFRRGFSRFGDQFGVVRYVMSPATFRVGGFPCAEWPSVWPPLHNACGAAFTFPAFVRHVACAMCDNRLCHCIMEKIKKGKDKSGSSFPPPMRQMIRQTWFENQIEFDI